MSLSASALSRIRSQSPQDLDWVQRRTLRACVLCRRKKVRCECCTSNYLAFPCLLTRPNANGPATGDGGQPPCTQCKAHKSQCLYLPRKSGGTTRGTGDRTRVEKQTPPPRNSPDLQTSTHATGTLDNSLKVYDAIEVSHPLNPAPQTQPLTNQSTAFEVPFWNGGGGSTINEQELDSHSASSIGEMLQNLGVPPNGTADTNNDLMVMMDPTSWFDIQATNQNTQVQIDDEDGEEFGYLSSAEEVTRSLQITICGHQKYMGPSVSFPPATKRGQEWITQVTGTKYFTNQITTFLNNWKPDELNWHTLKYNATHLPHIDVARVYVDAYFTGIQCIFPILDYGDFLQRFNETFENLDVNDDPVWCALVNSVLAIGWRAAATQSSSLESYEDQISALFQNALSLFPSIVFGPSDLYRVQTLVVMHIFPSFSSSPHFGDALLSNAARIAQAIGLHIQPSKTWGLSNHGMRQRKLAFWSLYCLDTDLCFRMGKPPLIRREDLTIKKPQSFSGNDVALPGRPPVSRIGCSLSDVSDQLLLFNNNIEMAHLLREIYDVTSSRIDLDHLSERASHLDRAISSLVESLRPEWRLNTGVAGKNCMNDGQQQILMPLVRLHCCILNARWNLNFHLHVSRTFARPDPRSRALLPEDVVPENLAVASTAAASLISIVQSLPSNHLSCSWIFNPYLVFAFYILFHAVLEFPHLPCGEKYMAVMSGVIESTVDGFFVHNPLISDKHLTHYLTFFSRTARMALRRSKDKMQDVDNFQGLEAYIDAGDGMDFTDTILPSVGSVQAADLTA